MYKIIISMTLILFFNPLHAFDQKQMIKDATNGKCETMECWNNLLIKEISDGQCETSLCLNKHLEKNLLKNASKIGCKTMKCLQQEINIELGLPKDYNGSYGARPNRYNVSGQKISSGNITKWYSDSEYVNGEITLEDGTTVSGNGRFVGKGIVRFNADGQTYKLEVD